MTLLLAESILTNPWLVRLAVFGLIAALAWVTFDWLTGSASRAEQRLDDFKDPLNRKRREEMAAGKGKRSDAMAVCIRLAQDTHIGAIVAIYRPLVERTAISFETAAPDREEMQRRVRETLRAYPWLVCDIDGHIAGYAYASRHRVRGAYQWSVDTSVYVNSSTQRRGVGRGLYASLFAILAALHRPAHARERTSRTASEVGMRAR